MTVILACLLLYAGCILFFRMRIRVPFGLLRLLSDFSPFMVPFNFPASLLSKVPPPPRIVLSFLPALHLVEVIWETLRDVAVALFLGGLLTAKDALPARCFSQDTRWPRFYLLECVH
jgi:Aspartyl/asparaginyl beta-hydroxylase and related dioxygenases